MAEAGRWKPYTQRQGQLLPAFVEDAIDPGDPVFFILALAAVPAYNSASGRYAVAKPQEIAIARVLDLPRWLRQPRHDGRAW
jgi:hypothetical protein